MTPSTSESGSSPMPWWLILIEGVFAAIVGISLLVAPGMTLSIIVQVLGLYWLFGGILAIVSIFINRTDWGLKLIAGIVGIIAGLIVIRHPLWSTILIPSLAVIVIAIGGIIIGIIDIVRAFKGAGWGIGILGMLSLLLGIILLLNPTKAAFASTLALGLIALGGGVIAIIMAFRLR